MTITFVPFAFCGLHFLLLFFKSSFSLAWEAITLLLHSPQIDAHIKYLHFPPLLWRRLPLMHTYHLKAAVMELAFLPNSTRSKSYFFPVLTPSTFFQCTPLTCNIVQAPFQFPYLKLTYSLPSFSLTVFFSLRISTYMLITPLTQWLSAFSPQFPPLVSISGLQMWSNTPICYYGHSFDLTFFRNWYV